MNEILQLVVGLALMSWATLNSVKVYLTYLEIKARRSPPHDGPIGSFIGCSSGLRGRVFVSPKDSRAIEIAACCSDKMTALTKYSVDEEEYEQLVARAEELRKPMQDWIMEKQNAKYFNFADHDFFDKHNKELRGWILQDIETEGLEE